MQIIDKDYKIEYDGVCYVLYFLKSKKEAKPDPKEPYKVAGYYSFIHNAFKAVCIWRETKKYPFKESSKELRAHLREYKIYMNKLDNIQKIIYGTIYDLKKTAFNEYKRLQCKPGE
ncbi:MAG: hypothetical protein ACOH2V_00730 [Candidatus Saccharimonadaceae bacterium]